MNKERENIDILHIPYHVHAYACAYETPDAIFQYSECPSASEPACWDCRFFEPEGVVDLSQPWPDESYAGDCRFHPPQVGDLIKRGTEDEERWFGNFPRVMACDWCGQFRRRGVDQ